jgi:cellulose 1,4-beta-cellobiosidase
VLVLTAMLAVSVAAPAAGVPAIAAQRSVHVDNPYAGARGYVDPQWQARAAGEPGGAQVTDRPTAVWLDSIGAVHGTDDRMGLRAHLDAALAQGAGYIEFVLNNLPGRDCWRLVTDAELAADDLDGYRTRISGVLPGGPERGQWFPAHFRQLLANAYPPLVAGAGAGAGAAAGVSRVP